MRLIGAAAIMAVLSVPAAAPVLADPVSVFKKLKGSWRGSGIVTPSKGGRERISCRVQYIVLGNLVTQTIKCAGADYRINVNGRLTIRGNKVSGSWIETNHDYSGGASGSVRGDNIKIKVRISGVNFTGTMNINLQGRSSHKVRITRFDPVSKKYVTMANISLRR